jgi:hypothetical protein
VSNLAYPSIPEPGNKLESLLETVRIMKLTIEMLTGQLKGDSQGAPRIFIQSTQPTTTYKGDLWVNDSTSNMFYWNGSAWAKVIV